MCEGKKEEGESTRVIPFWSSPPKRNIFSLWYIYRRDIYPSSFVHYSHFIQGRVILHFAKVYFLLLRMSLSERYIFSSFVHNSHFIHCGVILHLFLNFKHLLPFFEMYITIKVFYRRFVLSGIAPSHFMQDILKESLFYTFFELKRKKEKTN